MDNNITSARLTAELYEQEKREKEIERKEREFDKRISSETLSELKSQNAQLKKEYNESKLELKKSRKLNIITLIVASISAIAAVITMIIAILK